jgi:hypothetical protein
MDMSVLPRNMVKALKGIVDDPAPSEAGSQFKKGSIEAKTEIQEH